MATSSRRTRRLSCKRYPSARTRRMHPTSTCQKCMWSTWKLRAMGRTLYTSDQNRDQPAETRGNAFEVSSGPFPPLSFPRFEYPIPLVLVTKPAPRWCVVPSQSIDCYVRFSLLQSPSNTALQPHEESVAPSASKSLQDPRREDDGRALRSGDRSVDFCSADKRCSGSELSTSSARGSSIVMCHRKDWVSD